MTHSIRTSFHQLSCIFPPTVSDHSEPCWTNKSEIQIFSLKHLLKILKSLSLFVLLIQKRRLGLMTCSQVCYYQRLHFQMNALLILLIRHQTLATDAFCPLLLEDSLCPTLHLAGYVFIYMSTCFQSIISSLSFRGRTFEPQQTILKSYQIML